MLKIANFIMDAVAPRHCAGCRAEKEILCAECIDASFRFGASCVFCNFRNSTGRICGNCRKIYEPKFEKALWAGEYKNALKSAVWELKYGKRGELASPLGKIIFQKFKEYYPKYKPENFLIIPIPLHPKKEHYRGFNQARLIAKEFGKLSSIPLLVNSLIKISDTKTQVEIKTKEERIKNLENAFSLRENVLSSSNGKTIILIDDVATTGATFVHASRALNKIGFSKIICLAVAHGYG